MGLREIRQTHTFVKLPLSKAAFDEIKSKLLAAGYDHVFQKQDDDELIDMQGIAVTVDKEPDLTDLIGR